MSYVNNHNKVIRITLLNLDKFYRCNFYFCFFRGRTPDWYNKSYGHICALHLSKIRNSFKHTAEGPESKV